MQMLLRKLILALPLIALAACGDISFSQKNSPANQYKDYRPENGQNAAVLGVGEPLSARQMRADATITLKGQYDIEQMMQKVAATYNVAVRWGNGVRKGKRTDIIMNKLSFEEARSYVEDVFDVQIIREGDRRLLLLPSASEPRLKAFNPGQNVTLAEALNGLAQQCNYNLVISENRKQLGDIKVTTNFKDVTCFDAFEALLNPHGMSLVSEGDYFTVGGLPQRQWNVGLYEPVREETVSVNYTSDMASASSGEGSSSQSSSGSSKVEVTSKRDLWVELQSDLEALIANNCDPESADDAASTESMGANTLLPPPVMSTTKQNQATGESSSASASASATGGSSTTGSSESTADPRCGYVRVNKSVGVIQMRGPKHVLDEADDIIARVEDIANRRLLLEARVMAVTRTRDFERGARLKSNKGDGFGGFVGDNASITATLAGKLLSLQEAGGFASIRTQSLDAIVRLLEKYGTTYELMHPRLELMDRQRATLIDGNNERYFIIKSETTTGTSTTTNKSLDERSQFLGLQFSATAQVSDGEDEPHTISLQIPITSLLKTVNIPDPNNPSQSAGTAPVATTRLIDEKVRVRDGEIKVIGGLTRTLAFDKESGIPVFRETPAFGKLLSDEDLTYQNVEFVVLLQVRRLM